MLRNTVITRTLTQDDFNAFAELSLDDNPIHVDPEFAATTRFGGTVAHGLFLCTILRGLADKLVPGGRQLAQSVIFPAPTYVGRPIAFTAEVMRVNEGKAELLMRATDTTTGTETCFIEATFAQPLENNL